MHERSEGERSREGKLEGKENDEGVEAGKDMMKWQDIWSGKWGQGMSNVGKTER